MSPTAQREVTILLKVKLHGGVWGGRVVVVSVCCCVQGIFFGGGGGGGGEIQSEKLNAVLKSKWSINNNNKQKKEVFSSDAVHSRFCCS